MKKIIISINILLIPFSFAFSQDMNDVSQWAKDHAQQVIPYVGGGKESIWKNKGSLLVFKDNKDYLFCAYQTTTKESVVLIDYKANGLGLPDAFAIIPFIVSDSDLQKEEAELLGGVMDAETALKNSARDGSPYSKRTLVFRNPDKGSIKGFGLSFGDGKVTALHTDELFEKVRSEVLDVLAKIKAKKSIKQATLLVKKSVQPVQKPAVAQSQAQAAPAVEKKPLRERLPEGANAAYWVFFLVLWASLLLNRLLRVKDYDEKRRANYLILLLPYIFIGLAYAVWYEGAIFWMVAGTLSFGTLFLGLASIPLVVDTHLHLQRESSS